MIAGIAADLVIQPGESFRVRERIARLNDLGFSVDDVDLEPTDQGRLVRMRTRVGSRTFHSHRLRELTGIEASENQARQIFSDLNYHLSRNEDSADTLKSVGVMRWRLEVYEPMLAQISSVFPGDPIQGFCDLLNFRIGLARQRGEDVPNDEALVAWLDAGMPGQELVGSVEPT